MKKRFLGIVLTIVIILSFSAISFIGCGKSVEVTLSNSSKALFVGEEHQLTLSEDSVIVADGITWSSADSKIATVSNDGVVKGIAGGKVTITGETENGSATCEVTVTEVVATGMEIASNPTVTSYYAGGTFSSSGLSVKVSYNNNSDATITEGFSVSSPDMTTAGSKTVTVTYGEFTDTFSITVLAVEVSGVTIKTSPTKTSYYTNETFASSGLTLTVSYNDGSTEDITTGFDIGSIDMTTAGSKTVTVTYGGKSATFSITVTAVTTSSIAVKTNPSNTSYYVGDTFDSTGLVITATYNNGDTSDKSTGFTVSSPDMTTAGTKEVTVTYDSKTTTFDITVTAVAVTSIAVTAPTTTTYDEGDTLDLSGMVVTANYNNGTSSTIASGYTTSIASGAELATTDTSVSVTYEGFTQSFNITVNEVPVVATITGITVTAPTKTTYDEGDTLDLSGMVVTANYNNGTSSTITSGYTTSIASGAELATTDTSVSVTYEGFTQSFDITVNEVSDPADPVEPVWETTRFEAETAVIETNDTSLYDAEYLCFDMDLGGNLAVRNLSSTSDSYTFTFTSDEAVTDAVLEVSMAPYDGVSTLNEIVTLNVNETDVDTSSVDISYDASIDAQGLYDGAQNYKKNYLRFKSAYVEIDLLEGENIITFKSFKGNGGNFDYIDLYSPSTISGYTETPFTDGVSEWTVTTAPTADSTGILQCYSEGQTNSSSEPDTRNYTLETLSAENGYIVEGEGEDATYSFYVFDQKFEFKADGNVVSD